MDRISEEDEIMLSCPDREMAMEYMTSKAVWILYLKTGVKERDLLVEETDVAWKIWSVYEEEQKVKFDGIVTSRLKNHEIKIIMINKIQTIKALDADLRRLHFILQTAEKHVGLLSNYLIQ